MATKVLTHRKFTRKQRLKALVDRMTARRLKNKVAFPVMAPDLKQVYPVTYEYGVKSSAYTAGYHTGEDHACPEGSLALATSWGRVVFAGWAGSMWGSAYGNQVVMRTKDGKYDYAHNHLSKVLVRAGDEIHPGMVVGHTGATGNVTGPHSHFEARVAGGHYGSDVHPIHVKHK